jgi:hypothetical protein
MLRALAPYLAIALVVTAAGGVAYGLGAPTWIVYLTLLVAALAVLPGYSRWDQRHHPS